MLGRQRVPRGRRVVLQVLRVGHRSEPLPNVALLSASARGQFTAGAGSVAGQIFEQAQPIPQRRHGGVGQANRVAKLSGGKTSYVLRPLVRRRGGARSAPNATGSGQLLAVAS